MAKLTDIQILLMRQLMTRPLSRAARVPEFCSDLEAEGYVKMTAARDDLLVEITDQGRRALTDAERDIATPIEQFGVAKER
jgi:hypothetical protein